MLIVSCTIVTVANDRHTELDVFSNAAVDKVMVRLRHNMIIAYLNNGINYFQNYLYLYMPNEHLETSRCYDVGNYDQNE